MSAILRRMLAFFLGIVVGITGGALWGYQNFKPMKIADTGLEVSPELQDYTVEEFVELIIKATKEPDQFTFDRLEKEYGVNIAEILEKMGIYSDDVDQEDWNALKNVSLLSILKGPDAFLDNIKLRALYVILPSITGLSLDQILSPEAQVQLGDYTLYELLNSDAVTKEMGLMTALKGLKVGSLLPSVFDATYDEGKHRYTYATKEDSSLQALNLIANIELKTILDIADGADIMEQLFDGGLSEITDMPVAEILSYLLAMTGSDVQKLVGKYTRVLGDLSVSDLFEKVDGKYTFTAENIPGKIEIGYLLGYEKGEDDLWYTDEECTKRATGVLAVIADIDLETIMNADGDVMQIIEGALGNLSIMSIYRTIDAEGEPPMLVKMLGDISVKDIIRGGADNIVENVKNNLTYYIGEATLGDLIGDLLPAEVKEFVDGNALTKALMNLKVGDFIRDEYTFENMLGAIENAIGDVSIGEVIGYEKVDGVWQNLPSPLLGVVFDITISDLFDIIRSDNFTDAVKGLLGNLTIGDIFGNAMGYGVTDEDPVYHKGETHVTDGFNEFLYVPLWEVLATFDEAVEDTVLDDVYKLTAGDVLYSLYPAVLGLFSEEPVDNFFAMDDGEVYIDLSDVLPEILYPFVDAITRVTMNVPIGDYVENAEDGNWWGNKAMKVYNLLPDRQQHIVAYVGAGAGVVLYFVNRQMLIDFADQIFGADATFKDLLSGALAYTEDADGNYVNGDGFVNALVTELMKSDLGDTLALDFAGLYEKFKSTISLTNILTLSDDLITLIEDASGFEFVYTDDGMSVKGDLINLFDFVLNFTPDHFVYNEESGQVELHIEEELDELMFGDLLGFIFNLVSSDFATLSEDRAAWSVNEEILYHEVLSNILNLSVGGTIKSATEGDLTAIVKGITGELTFGDLIFGSLLGYERDAETGVWNKDGFFVTEAFNDLLEVEVWKLAATFDEKEDYTIVDDLVKLAAGDLVYTVIGMILGDENPFTYEDGIVYLAAQDKEDAFAVDLEALTKVLMNIPVKDVLDNLENYEWMGKKLLDIYNGLAEEHQTILGYVGAGVGAVLYFVDKDLLIQLVDSVFGEDATFADVLGQSLGYIYNEVMGRYESEEGYANALVNKLMFADMGDTIALDFAQLYEEFKAELSIADVMSFVWPLVGTIEEALGVNVIRVNNGLAIEGDLEHLTAVVFNFTPDRVTIDEDGEVYIELSNELYDLVLGDFACFALNLGEERLAEYVDGKWVIDEEVAFAEVIEGLANLNVGQLIKAVEDGNLTGIIKTITGDVTFGDILCGFTDYEKDENGKYHNGDLYFTENVNALLALELWKIAATFDEENDYTITEDLYALNAGDILYNIFALIDAENNPFAYEDGMVYYKAEDEEDLFALDVQAITKTLLNISVQDVIDNAEDIGWWGNKFIEIYKALPKVHRRIVADALVAAGGVLYLVANDTLIEILDAVFGEDATFADGLKDIIHYKWNETTARYEKGGHANALIEALFACDMGDTLAKDPEQLFEQFKGVLSIANILVLSNDLIDVVYRLTGIDVSYGEDDVLTAEGDLGNLLTALLNQTFDVYEYDEENETVEITLSDRVLDLVIGDALGFVLNLIGEERVAEYEDGEWTISGMLFEKELSKLANVSVREIADAINEGSLTALFKAVLGDITFGDILCALTDYEEDENGKYHNGDLYFTENVNALLALELWKIAATFDEENDYTITEDLYALNAGDILYNIFALIDAENNPFAYEDGIVYIKAEDEEDAFALDIEALTKAVLNISVQDVLDNAEDIGWWGNKFIEIYNALPRVHRRIVADALVAAGGVLYLVANDTLIEILDAVFGEDATFADGLKDIIHYKWNETTARYEKGGHANALIEALFACDMGDTLAKDPEQLFEQFKGVLSIANVLVLSNDLIDVIYRLTGIDLSYGEDDVLTAEGDLGNLLTALLNQTFDVYEYDEENETVEITLSDRVLDLVIGDALGFVLNLIGEERVAEYEDGEWTISGMLFEKELSKLANVSVREISDAINEGTITDIIKSITGDITFGDILCGFTDYEEDENGKYHNGDLYFTENVNALLALELWKLAATFDEENDYTITEDLYALNAGDILFNIFALIDTENNPFTYEDGIVYIKAEDEEDAFALDIEALTKAVLNISVQDVLDNTENAEYWAKKLLEIYDAMPAEHQAIFAYVAVGACVALYFIDRDLLIEIVDSAFGENAKFVDILGNSLGYEEGEDGVYVNADGYENAFINFLYAQDVGDTLSKKPNRLFNFFKNYLSIANIITIGDLKDLIEENAEIKIIYTEKGVALEGDLENLSALLLNYAFGNIYVDPDTNELVVDLPAGLNDMVPGDLLGFILNLGEERLAEYVEGQWVLSEDLPMSDILEGMFNVKVGDILDAIESGNLTEIVKTVVGDVTFGDFLCAFTDYEEDEDGNFANGASDFTATVNALLALELWKIAATFDEENDYNILDDLFKLTAGDVLYTVFSAIDAENNPFTYEDGIVYIKAEDEEDDFAYDIEALTKAVLNISVQDVLDNTENAEYWAKKLLEIYDAMPAEHQAIVAYVAVGACVALYFIDKDLLIEIADNVFGEDATFADVLSNALGYEKDEDGKYVNADGYANSLINYLYGEDVGDTIAKDIADLYEDLKAYLSIGNILTIGGLKEAIEENSELSFVYTEKGLALEGDLEHLTAFLFNFTPALVVVDEETEEVIIKIEEDLDALVLGDVLGFILNSVSEERVAEYDDEKGEWLVSGMAFDEVLTKLSNLSVGAIVKAVNEGTITDIIKSITGDITFGDILCAFTDYEEDENGNFANGASDFTATVNALLALELWRVAATFDEENDYNITDDLFKLTAGDVLYTVFSAIDAENNPFTYADGKVYIKAEDEEDDFAYDLELLTKVLMNISVQDVVDHAEDGNWWGEKVTYIFENLPEEHQAVIVAVGVGACVALYFIDKDLLIEIADTVLGEDAKFEDILAEPFGYDYIGGRYVNAEGYVNPLVNKLLISDIGDTLAKEIDELYEDYKAYLSIGNILTIGGLKEVIEENSELSFVYTEKGLALEGDLEHLTDVIFNFTPDRVIIDEETGDVEIEISNELDALVIGDVLGFILNSASEERVAEYVDGKWTVSGMPLENIITKLSNRSIGAIITAITEGSLVEIIKAITGDITLGDVFGALFEYEITEEDDVWHNGDTHVTDGFNNLLDLELWKVFATFDEEGEYDITEDVLALCAGDIAYSLLPIFLEENPLDYEDGKVYFAGDLKNVSSAILNYKFNNITTDEETGELVVDLDPFRALVIGDVLGFIVNLTVEEGGDPLATYDEETGKWIIETELFAKGLTDIANVNVGDILDAVDTEDFINIIKVVTANTTVGDWTYGGYLGYTNEDGIYHDGDKYVTERFDNFLDLELWRLFTAFDEESDYDLTAELFKLSLGDALYSLLPALGVEDIDNPFTYEDGKVYIAASGEEDDMFGPYVEAVTKVLMNVAVQDYVDNLEDISWWGDRAFEVYDELPEEQQTMLGYVAIGAAGVLYFVARDTLIEIVDAVYGEEATFADALKDVLGYEINEESGKYEKDGHANTLVSALYRSDMGDTLAKEPDELFEQFKGVLSIANILTLSDDLTAFVEETLGVTFIYTDRGLTIEGDLEHLMAALLKQTFDFYEYDEETEEVTVMLYDDVYALVIGDVLGYILNITDEDGETVAVYNEETGLWEIDERVVLGNILENVSNVSVDRILKAIEEDDITGLVYEIVGDMTIREVLEDAAIEIDWTEQKQLDVLCAVKVADVIGFLNEEKTIKDLYGDVAVGDLMPDELLELYEGNKLFEATMGITVGMVLDYIDEETSEEDKQQLIKDVYGELTIGDVYYSICDFAELDANQTLDDLFVGSAAIDKVFAHKLALFIDNQPEEAFEIIFESILVGDVVSDMFNTMAEDNETEHRSALDEETGKYVVTGQYKVLAERFYNLSVQELSDLFNEEGAWDEFFNSFLVGDLASDLVNSLLGEFVEYKAEPAYDEEGNVSYVVTGVLKAVTEKIFNLTIGEVQEMTDLHKIKEVFGELTIGDFTADIVNIITDRIGIFTHHVGRTEADDAYEVEGLFARIAEKVYNLSLNDLYDMMNDMDLLFNYFGTLTLGDFAYDFVIRIGDRLPIVEFGIELGENGEYIASGTFRRVANKFYNLSANKMREMMAGGMEEIFDYFGDLKVGDFVADVADIILSRLFDSYSMSYNDETDKYVIAGPFAKLVENIYNLTMHDVRGYASNPKSAIEIFNLPVGLYLIEILPRVANAMPSLYDGDIHYIAADDEYRATGAYAILLNQVLNLYPLDMLQGLKDNGLDYLFDLFGEIMIGEVLNYTYDEQADVWTSIIDGTEAEFGEGLMGIVMKLVYPVKIKDLKDFDPKLVFGDLTIGDVLGDAIGDNPLFKVLGGMKVFDLDMNVLNDIAIGTVMGYTELYVYEADGEYAFVGYVDDDGEYQLVSSFTVGSVTYTLNQTTDAEGNDVYTYVNGDEALVVDTDIRLFWCGEVEEGEDHDLVDEDGTLYQVLSGIMKIMARYTIGDLINGGFNPTDIMNEITLGEVITINEGSMLYALKDTTIGNLMDAMDDLTIGELMGFEKLPVTLSGDNYYYDAESLTKVWYEKVDSAAEGTLYADNTITGKYATDGKYYKGLTGVMKALADYTINELSGDLSSITDNLILGEVIDIDDDSLLAPLADKKISELMTAMNNMTIGQFMNYEKLLVYTVGDNHYYAGKVDLDADPNENVYVETLTVGTATYTLNTAGDVYVNEADGTDVIAVADIDAVWCGKVETLAEAEVIDATGTTPVYYQLLTGIIKSLADYKVTELSGDLSGITDNLVLGEVITIGEDSILYSLRETKIGDLMTAMNDLLIGELMGYTKMYVTYDSTTKKYVYAGHVSDGRAEEITVGGKAYTLNTAGDTYVYIESDTIAVTEVPAMWVEKGTASSNDFALGTGDDIKYYKVQTDKLMSAVADYLIGEMVGADGYQLYIGSDPASFSEHLMNKITTTFTLRDVLGNMVDDSTFLSLIADYTINDMSENMNKILIGELTGYIPFMVGAKDANGHYVADENGTKRWFTTDGASATNYDFAVTDGDDTTYYLEEQEKLITLLAGYTVGELTGASPLYAAGHEGDPAYKQSFAASAKDRILNEFYITDFIEADGNPILESLSSTPIGQLVSALNDMKVGSLLGYHYDTTDGVWKDSDNAEVTDKFMLLMCDYLVGQMTGAAGDAYKLYKVDENDQYVLDEYDEKIEQTFSQNIIDKLTNTLTLRDVLGETVDDNNLLKMVADTKLSGLTSAMNDVSIGELMGYTELTVAYTSDTTTYVYGYYYDDVNEENNTEKVWFKEATAGANLYLKSSASTLYNGGSLETPVYYQYVNDKMAQILSRYSVNQLIGAEGIDDGNGGTISFTEDVINQVTEKFTLKEVLGDNFPTTGIISKLGDTKVGEIVTAINSMELGELMGLTKTGGVWYDEHNVAVTDKLTLLIADKQVSEIDGSFASTLLEEIKTTLTVGDLFDTEGNSILTALKDTYLGNLSTAINDMYLGELMGLTKTGDVWYNGDEPASNLTALIAGKQVSEINGSFASTLLGEIRSTLTIGELLENMGDNRLLAALPADTTLDNLTTNLNGIQMGSMLGYVSFKVGDKDANDHYAIDENGTAKWFTEDDASATAYDLTDSDKYYAEVTDEIMLIMADYYIGNITNATGYELEGGFSKHLLNNMLENVSVGTIYPSAGTTTSGNGFIALLDPDWKLGELTDKVGDVIKGASVEQLVKLGAFGDYLPYEITDTDGNVTGHYDVRGTVAGTGDDAYENYDKMDAMFMSVGSYATAADARNAWLAMGMTDFMTSMMSVATALTAQVTNMSTQIAAYSVYQTAGGTTNIADTITGYQTFSASNSADYSTYLGYERYTTSYKAVEGNDNYRSFSDMNTDYQSYASAAAAANKTAQDYVVTLYGYASYINGSTYALTHYSYSQYLALVLANS